MFYVCESYALFRSVIVRNKHSALLEDEGHILVFIQLSVISSLSVWSWSDIHYSSRRFTISQMAARGHLCVPFYPQIPHLSLSVSVIRRFLASNTSFSHPASYIWKMWLYIKIRLRADAGTPSKGE